MAVKAERQGVYRLRVSYVLRFIPAVLLGRQRILASDVAGTLKGARPQPRIIDDQHIPSEGPFVLVANHYERPGLKVFWAGMLASYAVYQGRGDSLHWLMTSEWYNYRLGPIPVPVFVLRWLFRRIAAVYGLVIVPRATERVVGRAAAMRSILQAVQKERKAIALFPEGIGRGELLEPPAGAGALLLSLSERGIPVLPAGIFEDEGALTVRFGSPFRIKVTAQDKGERYRQARDQVMVNIGRLLPRPLWGAYTLAIDQLLSGRQVV